MARWKAYLGKASLLILCILEDSCRENKNSGSCLRGCQRAIPIQPAHVLSLAWSKMQAQCACFVKGNFLDTFVWAGRQETNHWGIRDTRTLPDQSAFVFVSQSCYLPVYLQSTGRQTVFLFPTFFSVSPAVNLFILLPKMKFCIASWLFWCVSAKNLLSVQKISDKSCNDLSFIILLLIYFVVLSQENPYCVICVSQVVYHLPFRNRSPWSLFCHIKFWFLNPSWVPASYLSSFLMNFRACKSLGPLTG